MSEGVRVVGQPWGIKQLNWRQDPSNGRRYLVVYSGTAEALNSLATALGPGLKADYDDGNGLIGTLTVDSPDPIDGQTPPDPGIATWEIIGNDIQKDLRTHPRSVALGAEVLSVVNAWAEAVLGATGALASDIYEEAVESIAAIAPPGFDANDLFELLIRRDDTYDHSQYNFRASRLIGTAKEITIASNNVDRIYSTAQVLSEVGPPGAITFALTDIASDYFEAAANSGFYQGWLKKTSSILQVAGGKVQVTSDFILDEYPRFKYSLAT